MAAIFLALGLTVPALSQTQAAAERLTPSLRASELLALKGRCGSAEPVSDSFQVTCQRAFDGPAFKTEDVVAFEENRFFIYAAGSRPGEEGPRLVRRFFFLKPATFVVDDQVRPVDSKGPVRWLLHTGEEPQIEGHRARVAEGDAELSCETLLPDKVTLKGTRRAPGGKQQAGHRVEVVPQDGRAETRFLHVLHVSGRGEEGSAARCTLSEKEGRLELTVSSSERTFRLLLPPDGIGSGQIAVAKADGEAVVERRLLPAGILPYGPQGVRLLERWDGAYHGGRRPGWDTGRPSSELNKAVEEGALRPGRAVVLGCGTGTNAVYLAGKGFDVTGIDIAPSALTQAKQKAQKAGVEVRWLVADVLAPPELEPFEVIFDRGCYHGVRRQNAAGYVEAVRRLSAPGTRLLIIAGNANEERRYGPPRIKEEEIRGDFSKLFDIERLRETRFDTADAERKGALAWSALLRRKEEPASR